MLALLTGDLVSSNPPSLVAVIAAVGSLGGVLGAVGVLLLLRQQKRLIAAQADKAEAEGGASMVSAAMTLVRSLREEEEACRKRLAEVASRQEEGSEDRANLRTELADVRKDLAFLREIVKEAGLQTE